MFSIQALNRRTIVFLGLFAAVFASSWGSHASAAEWANTGWRPINGAVQWKVIQVDRGGRELRYYFQNNTRSYVRVTGSIRYTDPRGKTQTEKFDCKVRPMSKRGGIGSGFVFFLLDGYSWRMENFRYSTI